EGATASARGDLGDTAKLTWAAPLATEAPRNPTGLWRQSEQSKRHCVIHDEVLASRPHLQR
ncbi:MAG: hypothetical protein J0626_01145, partial [Rhodospirillaceae bacterium]|nr:hypothetical protein [Rhodospirillaceae bacterium]